MENKEELKIIKLVGEENYVAWRFQVDIILKSSGKYAILNKGKLKEIDSEELKEKWMKTDGEVQRLIVTSVSEKVLLNLVTCESAWEMLDKLKNLYGRRSEVSLHALQQKFYAAEYDPKAGIAAHITKLENLSYSMKMHGEELTPGMLMSKILATISREYKHFLSAWDSTPASQRTYNNLTQRLLLEEKKLKGNRNEKEKDLMALMSKKSFKELKCFECGKVGLMKKDCWKNKKNQKEKPKCYSCGKIGHFKKDCRERKNERRNESTESRDSKGPKSEKRVYVAHGLCANVTKSKTNKWYMDSAATEHMTHNQNWIKNYERFETPRYVLFGDDTESIALGP